MSSKLPLWSKLLSASAWVNQVAISDNGRRVIGGTFTHDYAAGSRGPNRPGIYGTSAYDAGGNLLWSNSAPAWDGVFSVAISGDGEIAAGGGWAGPGRGFLQVYGGQYGGVLLDVSTIPARVNGISFSTNGGVLVAAADSVYVFVRDSEKVYKPATDPLLTTFFDGFVPAITVHPDGTWLAACGRNGKILVATIANGAITAVHTQTLTESTDPAVAGALTGGPPFLGVAIAAQSNDFIVGGGNSVYQSSLAAMAAGTAPVRYDAWDPGAPPPRLVAGLPPKVPENVRWVATSADGKFFAAVANRRVGLARSGAVLAFKKVVAPAPAVPIWNLALDRNPNGISMDRAGTYLAVADGYPIGVEARFYLFDKSGNQMWECVTPSMNWPIAVSSDGGAIAAGGDDGVLYYFLP